MANSKQIKDEALATIHAALTIIDKYPNLNNSNVALSLDTSTNPFNFLMDAFKSTAGYDTLINILSKFIAVGLPPLEVTVKGILLSNIKNLLSCSLNPFIPDDLLTEGIVFNLRQLDITDMLLTCPTDPKIGKYYYFGCDEMTIPDQIKDSEDFNALLWYMRNRSLKREVWKNERAIGGGSRPQLSIQDEKQDGIITLEYNERATDIKNAVGDGMLIQTPFNDSIHVFIGNADCMPIPSDSEIVRLEEQIISVEDEMYRLAAQNEDILFAINDLSERFNRQEITQEAYDTQYTAYSDQIKGNNDQINALYSQAYDLTQDLIGAREDYSNQLRNSNYKSIDKNYYYRRTLIEFNYDYIMSLKLFDPKVVTAQLLDMLTGLLNIDLSISTARQLIKNETLKMVHDIVESDDLVVSDCFFTFSNEDYDAMMQKSEMVRSGLFTINGEENSNVIIDPASILNSLNQINPDSTEQELETIIQGAITEISGTITSTSYEIDDNVNFGVRMNFIENLMNHLACVITLSVLSPKVYLLILINLKTLGRETNFNLKDFIAMFKQLIASLIRAVRDALIQYLLDELLKLLSSLAASVSAKIAIEQAEYYTRLIKKLIDCFRRDRGSSSYDFSIDQVNHADIIQEEEQPKNAEC